MTQIARALGGLGDAHYAAFELISARQKYQECISFSEQHDLRMVGDAHRHMLSYTSFLVSPGEEAMELSFAAVEQAVAEENSRSEFAARVDLLDYLALNLQFDEFEHQLGAISTLLNKIGENRFQSDLDGAKCVYAQLHGDSETLYNISHYQVQKKPTPYIWPVFAALHACSLDNFEDRQSWLDRGEALLSKASLSHSVLFFYHHAAEAMRDRPDIALAYCEKLKERSGAELSGFAGLSIRTSKLRADPTPDDKSIASLKEDLRNARLKGFWPELFSKEAQIN